jgi:hypothetical protein
MWAGAGVLKRITTTLRSVVIKEVAIHKLRADTSTGTIRKLKSYCVEQAFYEHFSPLLPPDVIVPRLLGVGSATGECIILSDLDADAIGCNLNVRRSTVSKAEARACLKWLARFHATFFPYESPSQPPASSSSSSSSSAALLWETGCYWHLKTRSDELRSMDDRDVLKIAASELDDLLEAAKYKTILHGDAKVANFCFPAATSASATDSDTDTSIHVGALDFQYCGRGIGVRDVVYFLGSVYNDDELERNIEDMTNYYFSRLQAAPEVEAEWRSLICVCFADFERFLRGWSPCHRGARRQRGKYAQKMCDQALKLLNF